MTKRAKLTAAALGSVIVIGGSLFVPPHRRTFTDLAPDGHLSTAPTYNAVVNDADGRNVAHVFEYGRYTGNTWEPTGKTFVWSK